MDDAQAMTWLQEHLVSVGTLGAVSLFSFLIKSYFDRFQTDISRLVDRLSKIETRLEIMQDDIRSNTIENTRLVVEFKSMWRFVNATGLRHDDAGDYNRS